MNTAQANAGYAAFSVNSVVLITSQGVNAVSSAATVAAARDPVTESASR